MYLHRAQLIGVMCVASELPLLLTIEKILERPNKHSMWEWGTESWPYRSSGGAE